MGKIKLRPIKRPISHEVLVAVAFACAVTPYTQSEQARAKQNQQARTNDGE